MFTDPLLAALSAIHRRGSFDLAASSLGITPSAISQRLKSLEERMGTPLIRRGQPCTATPPGLRLIRHHDEVALLQSQLTQDLPQLHTGPATIRIAVNADSLATWVIPALAKTNDMLFDLVIDDQEYSQDWLKRGEVSAAITSHPGPLQGCDTIPLGALRYHATASPAYIAKWLRNGTTKAALTRAPALTFSDKDRLQSAWLHSQFGSRSALPTHRLASAHAFVDAALAGLGWGMNPEPLIAGYLADGTLTELIPNTPLDVPLYWQFSRLTAPALAPVTRAVQKVAASILLHPNASPNPHPSPKPPNPPPARRHHPP